MPNTMSRAVLVLVCVASTAWPCWAASNRYGFYRNIQAETETRRAGDTRRVFGGSATTLSSFSAACVLMDRYWSTRCSAAVVSPYWALTAAHCVLPQIAYVKYNSRRPSTPDGDVSAVIYLYRHPSYKVLQEDEGRGVDVTLLQNDVGLLRTRTAMMLVISPELQPVSAWRLYNLEELENEEVQVLGFGRTETLMQGEELYEVRLRLVPCERSTWERCVCGSDTESSDSGNRGVCSGDSGGPVLYRGAQVGVTSMGPLECTSGLTDPLEGAANVFTSLYPYADLLNATIHDTEQTLRMRRVLNQPTSNRAATVTLGAGAVAVLLVRPTR